jgi:hypothetical protein
MSQPTIYGVSLALRFPVELVPLFLPERTLKLIRGLPNWAINEPLAFSPKGTLVARETEPEFPVQPSLSPNWLSINTELL